MEQTEPIANIPPSVMNCCVCQLSFSNKDHRRLPRLLKCGHTFCSGCLENTLVAVNVVVNVAMEKEEEEEEEEEEGQPSRVVSDAITSSTSPTSSTSSLSSHSSLSSLSCPTCNEVTLVGQNGVKSLGTNLPLLESIQLLSAPMTDWVDEEDDDGWSALYCPEPNFDECEICFHHFDDASHSRAAHPSSVHPICRSCLSKLRDREVDEPDWIMPADPPVMSSSNVAVRLLENSSAVSAVSAAVNAKTEEISTSKCVKKVVTATAASTFAKKTVEETATVVLPAVDLPFFRNFLTKSVSTSVVTEASKKIIFASSGGAAALCDFGISSAQDAYRWSKGDATAVRGIAKNLKNATLAGICSGTGFVLAGPVGAFVGGMLAPKTE